MDSPRTPWCLLLLPLLAACAVPRIDPTPPPGHPANPRAAEAEFVPPPSPFADEPQAAESPGEPAPPAHPHAGAGHGANGDAAYVCPMHPDETSREPGNCSQCGMALVPRQPETPRHESPRP